MIDPLLGLVLHVEQGGEAGTDQWFHEPGSEVSAHFGSPRDVVQLDQWVSMTDRAWAEAAGNSRWLSVETAGFATDELDSEQLHTLAALYADLHRIHGFPFRTSESPTEAGFGWHGMGGEAWGGHPDCPGDKRKAQRGVILAKALTIVHPSPSNTPRPSPHPVTPRYPGQLLEVGRYGHGVKELTEQLQARGWRIAPTMTYDPAVERVVAEFQAEKDLRVDGVVGPVTWFAVWHAPVTP
jgi:peptidoglycan hydrolase-like protein with peptidoglycan-binding domain